MRQKETAPSVLRKAPETFCWALILSSGHLFQTNAPGDESRLSVWDAPSGKRIWQRSIPDLTTGAPVVESEGMVYVSAHNALYALRASNGVVLWQHQEQTPENLA